MVVREDKVWRYEEEEMLSTDSEIGISRGSTSLTSNYTDSVI